MIPPMMLTPPKRPISRRKPLPSLETAVFWFLLLTLFPLFPFCGSSRPQGTKKRLHLPMQSQAARKHIDSSSVTKTGVLVIFSPVPTKRHVWRPFRRFGLSSGVTEYLLTRLLIRTAPLSSFVVPFIIPRPSPFVKQNFYSFLPFVL